MKMEYIRAAKEACAHVYKLCPLGSSNRHNGQKYEDIEAATVGLIKEKQDFDEKIEKIQAENSDPDQQYYAIIKLLAETGMNAKAGNCQEMAAIAFLFLMGKVAPIEIVFIPTHTFVVIGRSPSTPIDNPSNWNNDVVICDPWRREYKQQGGDLFYKELNVFSTEKLIEELGKSTCATLEVGYGIYDAPIADSSLAIAPH